MFRDQEFSSDMRSRAVKRIQDVRELRARQFVEDAGPLAHPVRPNAYREINNFYTATVYEKGAEVIRMLKLLIGDQAFKAGMDLYFARHDGEAATIEQFVACFAESSGRDLGPFSRWYDQAGTPRVTVQHHYDAAQGAMRLRIRQETPPTPGQPEKRPQVVPIAAGIVSANGASTPTQILVLEEAEAEFVFENVAPDATPSLLRGFSAPVNLEIELSDTELLTLARLDSDPFNRWQSLQSLAMKVLKRSAAAVRQGEPALTHDGLAQAAAALLRDGLADPAFTALAITLPGEQDIARETGADVDPDAIHLARRTLRQAIGRDVFDLALAARSALADGGPYSPEAAAAERRALRNAALDLMAMGRPTEGAELAFAQFETANNMTDRFAALSILVHGGSPKREEALARFEADYRANPLVMDKWFSLQAVSPEADTLARVRTLMRHPAFTLSNPNRARALIGGFAMSNPVQFNRADGEGYEFVAETVLEIDPRNPQVAARIMTAFRSWRTLEPGRRAKAQDVLVRFSKRDGLSRDLRDIVERTLT